MQHKSFHPTEVGLLAIWDSESLSFIDEENYFDYFVENRTMADLMNKGSVVVWGTGGDGNFGVTVRVNPQTELSVDEQSAVEMKALNLKLIVTSDNVVVGSPECVGVYEEKSLKNGSAVKLEGIELGTYSVNLYFLYDEKEKDSLIGHVAVLNKVGEDHKFEEVQEPPRLG